MSDHHHIEPTDEQMAEIANHPSDKPFIALNLNRYRKRAAYPPGTPDSDVSGRTAYGRYGLVAAAAILSVGGRILWFTEGKQVAIGCPDDDYYNEVVAVWYPSRKAFLRLEEYPGYREALETHRRAALESAVLLFCDANDEPVLTSPFGAS